MRNKPHIRKARGNGDRWIVEKPHPIHGAQMAWVDSWANAIRTAKVMAQVSAK